MQVKEPNDNHKTGWIKIFRSVRDHWVWRDPRKFQWWIDILLEVNHSPKTVAIGYKLFNVNTGESLNSIDTWAKRWGVNKKTAYNFLKMLKNATMITLESVTVSTRLTVCNYDIYQQIENGKGTEKERKKNAKETPDGHKQELKNDIPPIPPDGENIKTWRNDFEVYKSGLREVYLKLISDREYINKQAKYYPNVDIKLSLEKACTNFWATEAGWKNKKSKRSKNIDWKSTLTNAIEKNKVYFT